MRTATQKIAIYLAISTSLLFPLKSVCQNTNRTTTFDNYKCGFSITLPDNWETMPDAKLALLNDNATKANPSWKKPALHYGYQQKDSQDFVFSPFILIRVMELNHVPTPEFTRAELIADRKQVVGINMDDPVFDSELEAFVAFADTNVEGREPTTNAAAFFQTHKSLIKVFCFASPTDVKHHPELLRQMFGGVRIYDDYKTSGAKRSPTGLIVSIIAIGIMVLVMWKSKPAKSHSEGSPANLPKVS